MFADSSAREQLEQIVHPLVQQESHRQICELIEQQQAQIVMYDAALLVETGRHREFDRLIVVFVPAEIQLERLIKRDQADADSAGARIRAQMPLSEKVAVADYVIDNSGHWQQTRQRVAQVHSQLQEDLQLLRAGQELPSRSA